MTHNIEAAFALIIMAIVGMVLIEIRDRWRMSQIIKLRLAALQLDPDAICRECGCKQRNHDYGNKNKGHLGISNLMP